MHHEGAQLLLVYVLFSLHWWIVYIFLLFYDDTGERNMSFKGARWCN